MHKTVYLSYMIPYLANCVKSDPIKELTHSTSVLWKFIGLLNFIKDLGSYTHPGVPLDAYT